MYLVVIAWLYVALMMAIAEASSPIGTIIGGLLHLCTLWRRSCGVGGLRDGHAAQEKSDQGTRGG
jgi:hypothetical protein